MALPCFALLGTGTDHAEFNRIPPSPPHTEIATAMTKALGKPPNQDEDEDEDEEGGNGGKGKAAAAPQGPVELPDMEKILGAKVSRVNRVRCGS